jgi:hypothetical protein
MQTVERTEKRWFWAEAALAALAFAALCLVVLRVAPQAAEPDDGAYRASIIAIADGHFLSLSKAQALTLARKLGDNPAVPPNQWVELPNGRWISEKNPGYPFLAAPFQALGAIRWAPLFYGALACLGLFISGRRWLGRFGGLSAVGLYCSSGAALAFAWRDHMPTFTDASLVAAGCGLLMWALLATEARTRRRTITGVMGFVALELATFVRYTDVLMLGCAVVAVGLSWRLCGARLPRRAVGWWLCSVAVFGAGVALFDDVVYGGPVTSGYQPGEVTFSLRAIWPNLRLMPAHLVRAMPMLAFGLLAIVWIIVQWLLLRQTNGNAAAHARQDLSVCVALAASWLAIWVLYSTYTWTTDPTNGAVSEVRFYVPAMGPIALLGAWLVTRLPAPPWLTCLTATAIITALFGLGVWAVYGMYAAIDVPLNS